MSANLLGHHGIAIVANNPQMQIETIFVPAELALHLIRHKVRYKKIILFYEPSRHAQALACVHACSDAAGALVTMTDEVQRLC